mmetsp:Transcript_16551/g.50813  ORF Transcript_16551/g.50813 Transcript_16551/m.50813 type:complete len:226 (+) Transcript_16551:138-815(+)
MTLYFSPATRREMWPPSQRFWEHQRRRRRTHRGATSASVAPRPSRAPGPCSCTTPRRTRRSAPPAAAPWRRRRCSSSTCSSATTRISPRASPGARSSSLASPRDVAVLLRVRTAATATWPPCTGTPTTSPSTCLAAAAAAAKRGTRARRRAVASGRDPAQPQWGAAWIWMSRRRRWRRRRRRRERSPRQSSSRAACAARGVRLRRGLEQLGLGSEIALELGLDLE